MTHVETAIYMPLNTIRDGVSTSYISTLPVEKITQHELNRALSKWLAENPSDDALSASRFLSNVKWSISKNDIFSFDESIKSIPASFFNFSGEIVDVSRQQSGVYVKIPLMINDFFIAQVEGMIDFRQVQKDKNSLYKNQLLFLSVIGLLVFVASILTLSYIIHKKLLPIRTLTKGIGELKKGNYLARVTYEKDDDLKELFDSFNLLGINLDKKYKSQRRWLANISHELRTPITTLNCEIESLEDGLTKFDIKQLNSFTQEVKRLQYLVDDLYELSLSEAGGFKYNFAPLDLSGCIEKVINSYSVQSKKLDIQLIFTPEKGLVFKGDTKRISQLFTNVIKNSLAYTTSPGAVTITTKKKIDFIRIIIEDTPPAPKKDAEKLFDPFFRGTNEHNLTKGAGLGLTICRNIVEAHDGKINAKLSKFGGLCITIEFPTAIDIKK